MWRSESIKSIAVTFKSGELSLEGQLRIPEGEGPFPAVVVCHPHPQYGGSMDNLVVNSICNSLAEISIVSLKFNFRGVDGSQGTFDNGIGEQDDVRSAISYMLSVKEVDPHRAGLAGYSAGSAWGLTAACGDIRIKALAAISPPLSMFDFQCLLNCTKPKLMISGSEDEWIPVKQFVGFCRSFPEPKECFTVDGADHFWMGFDAVVAEKVTDFFKHNL